MKIKELRSKSKGELKKLLKEKSKRIQELRFQLSSGKAKNKKEIKEIKKDVARILTSLKYA